MAENYEQVEFESEGATLRGRLYRFISPAPTNGSASALAEDEELEEYLHLYLLNRGVLMTPFHNMALMCPQTSSADVELHTVLFAKAVGDLVN